ncbi:uncharacterized protein E0L32_007935 [Thyridium curvatum]|uniref:DUF6594 domain-containing protein n=1 Tax=Thyridium curvatum TaxID=1093900 RepID=A0A507AX91_9PEZI|nr:uncharacterized protein E0L32_007935 [Thyridium curvatum]TPX11074.1 hypothetical protein E0L32_007935 [Thyridium curvatum]
MRDKYHQSPNIKRHAYLSALASLFEIWGARAMAQPTMPLGPPRDDHCDPEPMMSAAVSMAANEDVTIVRRFDELNILSLLLLQDDINKLSNELKQLCPIRSQNTEAPNDCPLISLYLEYLLKSKAHTDAALIDLARLRNLEPPDPNDLERLRGDLTDIATKSQPLKESLECWEPKNENDLVVLRGGSGRGSRLNIWVKLGLEILKWEFWGKSKHGIGSDCPFFSSLACDRDGKEGTKSEQGRDEEEACIRLEICHGAFGGIALIVPTAVMSKFEGVNTSLVTTSISVVLFGFVLAFGASDSTGKDVLTATAAYTAVLVVFVGSTSG